MSFGPMILVIANLSGPAAEALKAQPAAQVRQYHAVFEKNGATIEARVFPQHTGSKSYEILSPREDDRPPNFKKLLSSFEEELPDNKTIWCSDVVDIIDPSTEEVISEGAETSSYRFQRIAADAGNGNEVRYAKVAFVDVTVQHGDSGWQVIAFRQGLKAPFKPMIAAKMTALDMLTTCAPAPDGRMFWASTETTASGSVLGRSISEHVTLHVSDLVLDDD